MVSDKLLKQVNNYLDKKGDLPKGFTHHTSYRNYCELCGKKLNKPETDFTKIAICDKCLKGQYK